jgi:hypothetical protein
MKKILIGLFLICSIPLFGQRIWSIDVANITGTDTTIYLRNQKHGLLTFDFTNFDADDATLDVGLTDNTASFVTVSVSGVTFPITLSTVTYTKTTNGYTKHRVAFKSSNWTGTYIGFKLTKTSVTAGTLTVWY